MKIRDLIQKDIDIDVYDDYNEELGIAFVGPLKLTEEGEKRFAWVLDRTVEISDDCVIVHADSDEEVACYREFFLAAAGYCGEYAYKMYFVEEEDDD